MSCFFPSGVSAMINESPPCPGRINGFRRLKTILARSASPRIRSGLSICSLVAASTLPRLTRFIAEELCCDADFALTLESVGGGLAGLAESRRQGRSGGRGIDRGHGKVASKPV